MKKIFIDTNVLVDLIADRKPFSKHAIELFSRAEKRKVKLFTSSHAMATTYYLLKKYIEENKLREILYDLTDFLTIVAIDHHVIRMGLKSKHKDFEDALQMISAYSIPHIDCIVTRNVKDFKASEIPVFTPDQVIGHL